MYFSVVLIMVCIGGALSCCSPEQWEAVVSIVGAYKAGNGGGVLFSVMKGSYDATSQKMAAKTVSSDLPNPAYVLKDYPQGIQYVVPADGRSCQVSRIDRTFPYACVPPSAYKTGDAYVGVGSNKVFEENYSIPPSETGLRMFSTNKNECIPSTQMFLGFFDGKHLTSTIFFGNTTLGIKDPSVFDIPVVCKDQPVPLEPATGGYADFYESYNIFKI